MGYEINVARKGKDGRYRHLFATDIRSIPTESRAKELYKMFKEKFPEPEYDITVTYLETIGHPVKF